ncbi:MAG: hypothetical protein Q8N88_03470, partial [Nanoarchaeota archaeon]|nr:hypothetical protein [Nanoarchaeota archaeon]
MVKNKIIFLVAVFFLTSLVSSANYISTDDVYGGFRWDDYKNYSAIWNENLGNLFFTSGNIGIGTTAPVGKLNVNGSINISGTGNKLIFPDGSFLTSNSSLGSGTITGAGSSGYIPTFNGTGSINNSVIYQNGSNIGIGTTSPGGKMEINGSL